MHATPPPTSPPHSLPPFPIAWLVCLVCLACALVLLATTSPARAQEPATAHEPPKTDAAALARALKEGAAAAARADHAACVEAYSKAWRIAPEATTAGRLGLCEEALGHDIVAYNLLRLALESEPPPAKGGGQAPWKRFEEVVVRLERRVARAIVVTTPNDAEVFLDGVSLGKKLSGRYITVAPGEHTWLARRDGYKPATFTHTARAGDMPDVRLFCEPLQGDTSGQHEAPPCDDACRAKVQKNADADANLKWKIKLDYEINRMRREAKLIYGKKVDPSFAMLVGLLGSVGLTTDVGPGFYFGGEVTVGAFNEVGFSTGLEVRTLFPTKAFIRSDGEVFDISQVTVAAVPCLRYKWFAGCVVADVGTLIGGGPPPLVFYDTPAVVTAHFGPRLGFQVPFAEWFMFRGFVELRISPVSTGYDVGVTSPRTWDNPLVTGLAGIGVSFGGPVVMNP